MSYDQQNNELFLNIQQKYRQFSRQVRQYQRQIGGSFNQLAFITQDHQKFFRVVQSTCFDFDLIMLEVTTDLSCFKLEKIGSLLQAMFKLLKTNLQRLSKHAIGTFTNNKNIKTKFIQSVCKNCNKNLEEVKLNLILDKTTLTKNEMNQSNMEKQDTQDVKKLELDSFLGSDRQQFIRVLQQALNQKSLSLSKKPAETQQILRSFLDDFKQKNETGTENKEKLKIIKVLQDIKKEQTLQFMNELTGKVKRQLFLTVRQPLLQYIQRLSQMRAEQLISEFNSRIVKVDQQVQTTQTNISQMIRKYENKIKTLSSELGIRKQRTKQLQKQLLSSLLSNSNHSQMMSDNKLRLKQSQELRKKTEQTKQLIEHEFNQYKKQKSLLIDKLVYNFQQQLQDIKQYSRKTREEADRLRQQNYKLSQKKITAVFACQTTLVKLQNQGMQTMFEKQIKKKPLKAKRDSKVSASLNMTQLSRIQEDFAIENLQKQERISHLSSTSKMWPSTTKTQKLPQTVLQIQNKSSRDTIPLSYFVHEQQKLDNRQQRQRIKQKQIFLSHLNQIINITIQPIQNISTVTTPKSLSKITVLKQNISKKSAFNIVKRFPKFGHKPNRSQIITNTHQRYKTQHNFSSDKIKKQIRNLHPKPQSTIIENKSQFSSVVKQHKAQLKLHNISYQPNIIQSQNKQTKQQESLSKTIIIQPLQQQKQPVSEQSIISKRDIMKQIPQKMIRMNTRISGIDLEQEINKQLEVFKSLNKDVKKQKNRNIDIKQIQLRSKDFYVDNEGQRVKIKEKVNEVKNVLLYQFDFLFKIGFIDVLEKLNRRIINQKKHLMIKMSHNTPVNLNQNITFTTKDLNLFGGYQGAMKYETGRGLWSPQIHNQNYASQVNKVITYIQSFNTKLYEDVSNFLVNPIKFVIYDKKSDRIKHTHLRVTLNLIYSYHQLFCDNCSHVSNFLTKIKYC